MLSTEEYPVPNLFKRIDLRRLYPRQGRNQQVMVFCPFHEDSHRPSMCVYRANAYCHTCHRSESAKDHIIRTRHLTTQKQLWSILNSLLSHEDYEPEEEAYESLTPISTATWEIYVDEFRREPGYSHRKKWLQQKYGIGLALAQQAGIGYAEDAYVLPVYDLLDRILTFRFRHDPTSDRVRKTKYWGVPGRNRAMWYFPPAIRHDSGSIQKAVYKAYGTNRVLVTEGEYDALALEMLHIPAISATNGANALLNDHHELGIHDLDGLQVWICYDQDETGFRASAQVKDRLTEAGIQAKIAQWNPTLGKDASELIAGGMDRKSFLSLLLDR